ncbi:UNVERIFIED_CONTAM: Putrescine hydroxycinnamoyltransferase, partial [Sesamum radiatum]
MAMGSLSFFSMMRVLALPSSSHEILVWLDGGGVQRPPPCGRRICNEKLPSCVGISLSRLDVSPLPFRDRTIFSPRNPPKFEFEHREVEYITKNLEKVFPLIDNSVKDIVVHKIHYSKEFLSKLKAMASSMNRTNKPFSTFESLVAYLWRAITKASGLNGLETTQVRIPVDGRYRLNPRVPNEYFGNLVLWAFARAKVDDLLREPLSYATKLLHEAIMKVMEEDLVPSAIPDTKESILWPNLEVASWLRSPCYNLDFGGG